MPTPARVKREDLISAAFRLQQEAALRACELSQKTAQVCMTAPPSGSALQEATALAEAAVTRAATLQISWLRAWTDWVEFVATIDGADTTAKYADRLNNIALRAEAQVATQVTDSLELLDNVTVSYAYWLTQRLEGEG